MLFQHTFYMQNENACEQGQGFHDQIADTLFKNISEVSLVSIINILYFTIDDKYLT